MKLLFRIVKWLLIISLVVFALLQIDDNQSAESKAWIDEVHASNSKPSQAFYLQLGLMAPEGKDPIEFGRDRLKKAEEAYGDHTKIINNHPVKFDDPIIKSTLQYRLPTTFCSPDKVECIDKIHASKNEHVELLNKNRTLLSRYQKFLKLDDYRIATSPNLILYFVDYQQIINANKLMQLDILLNSNDTEGDTHKLIQGSRKKLASSNALIAKMVHLANVQLNLDFYNSLLVKRIIKGEQPLKNTSALELSIESSVKLEHAVAQQQIKLMEAYQSTGTLGFLKKIWSKTWFKSNMSTNQNLESLKAWLAFSKLPAKEQAKKDNINKVKTSQFNKYRNYGGWALSTIPVSAYKDYSLRLHNLQAKINLLNWYRENKDSDIRNINLKSMKSLNNFGDEAPYLIEKDTYLCLAVPFNHKRNHHCIRL